VNSQENIDIYRWTARRAAQRSSFVAADLAAYRAMQEASEEDLARFLSCQPEALADLALCKRPDPSKLNFKTEVQRIASFVRCDDIQLAKLLREVDAVNIFRSAAEDSEGAADAGLLAAARDAGSEGFESSLDAEDLDEDDEDPEHQ
jgi:hypothetical protein